MTRASRRTHNAGKAGWQSGRWAAAPGVVQSRCCNTAGGACWRLRFYISSFPLQLFVLGVPGCFGCSSSVQEEQEGRERGHTRTRMQGQGQDTPKSTQKWQKWEIKGWRGHSGFKRDSKKGRVQVRRGPGRGVAAPLARSIARARTRVEGTRGGMVWRDDIMRREGREGQGVSGGDSTRQERERATGRKECRNKRGAWDGRRALLWGGMQCVHDIGMGSDVGSVRRGWQCVTGGWGRGGSTARTAGRLATTTTLGRVGRINGGQKY